MGFLPAQRLSADQLTVLSTRPERLAAPVTARVPNPGRRPSRPFSGPHGSYQVCLATIFRPLPLSGFALQSFAPQDDRRWLAPPIPPSTSPPLPEDRPRGFADRPRAAPSTSPCCRRRQAVALLGVPVRPYGCPLGRHVRPGLRRITVVLPPTRAPPGPKSKAPTRAVNARSIASTAKHPPRSLTAPTRVPDVLRQGCLPWGYLLLEAPTPCDVGFTRCSDLSGCRSPLGVRRPRGFPPARLPSPVLSRGPDEAASSSFSSPTET